MGRGLSRISTTTPDPSRGMKPASARSSLTSRFIRATPLCRSAASRSSTTTWWRSSPTAASSEARGRSIGRCLADLQFLADRGGGEAPPRRQDHGEADLPPGQAGPHHGTGDGHILWSAGIGLICRRRSPPLLRLQLLLNALQAEDVLAGALLQPPRCGADPAADAGDDHLRQGGDAPRRLLDLL